MTPSPQSNDTPDTQTVTFDPVAVAMEKLRALRAELAAANQQIAMDTEYIERIRETGVRMEIERDKALAELAQTRKLLADANRGAETNAHVNRGLADRVHALAAELEQAKRERDDWKGYGATVLEANERLIAERDGMLAQLTAAQAQADALRIKADSAIRERDQWEEEERRRTDQCDLLERELVRVRREKVEEADALRKALRAIEWSGTAHGAVGATARRCPVCCGVNPNDSLAEGGGRYSRGLGHAADCALAAALRGATEAKV